MKNVEEQLKLKAFLKVDALKRMEIALNLHLQLLREATTAAGKEVADTERTARLLHDVKGAILQKEKTVNPPILQSRRQTDQGGPAGIA